MLNGIFTGRYDRGSNGTAASGALSLIGSDMKLQASVTDATFVNGPFFTDLSLSLEKPGSFIIDYDVPKKDFEFQFMRTVKVLDRPLNLTYKHAMGSNRTMLDGTLELNSANKLSVNYGFDHGNCKLQYSFAHPGGTTIEPGYDFGSNSWDIAASHRLCDDSVLRVSYENRRNVLGLEWLSDSKSKGAYKISAAVNLAEGLQIPRLSTESSWNFDISQSQLLKELLSVPFHTH